MSLRSQTLPPSGQACTRRIERLPATVAWHGCRTRLSAALPLSNYGTQCGSLLPPSRGDPSPNHNSQLTGHRAVDPKRQNPAPCGHFQRVPFASRFHPDVRDLLAQIERFLLAVRSLSLLTQQAVFSVPVLRLMPDRAVLGVTDVSAAVVTCLAPDLGVAKLEVKNGVADFLVEQQHVMPAISVADQNLLLAIDMPLFPAQLAGGRHGQPIPALEVRWWKNVRRSEEH